ncbi:MAG: efflux RND transporter periplasmic adaptor subunit [Methylococcales bacterium]|nr:efflux RND transporter periplasmic adaptor subunit [Methylococcales bacterium]
MKQITLLFFLVWISLPAHSEETWATLQPSYREVTFTGFSRARHSMTLATEVSGKVSHIFVDTGDTIPSDGKVSCLDDTFTRIDISSTQNDIEQAKIDVAYYKKQVGRYQKLTDKKSASLNQLDDMKRQLGTAKRVEQRKRLLKQRQQETLSRHCIKSPAGWMVDERYIEQGQWLNVGNPIAKVGDYSTLRVPFALSVDELNALKSNERDLSVWLPEYQQQVHAIVERISPAFDKKSRKIQVDLLLSGNLPAQRGGLRVILKLMLPDPSHIFWISANALDQRFEEVWLHRKDGQSLQIELLGSAKNGQARVSSPDLKRGDQFKLIQH